LPSPETTAQLFRDLGLQLIEAAAKLEAGSPLRDVDPLMRLARATGSGTPGQSELANELRRDTYDENGDAARAHPMGSLILELLSMGRSWEGTSGEFAAAGEELELPATIDTALLVPSHWFSRGIAAAGANVHVDDTGTIHLSRQQWFSFKGRRAPLEGGSGPRITPHVLRGAWIAQGIDPDLCIYCLSAPFQEIEHFVPRSKGGANEVANMFPSCRECNRGQGSGKFARDPWGWLEEFHPDRLAYFREFFGLAG
jgi:hypothetical protein